MRKIVYLSLLLSMTFIFSYNVSFSQFITHKKPLPEIEIPKPDILETFLEPCFGTKITRITEAEKDTLPGIFNDYPRRQAWNCDESMLILFSGRKQRIYDGQNYTFIKTINLDNPGNVIWHTSNPNILYYSKGTTFYQYDVVNDIKTPLIVFDDLNDFPSNEYYKYVRTGKGDISRDGRYHVNNSYANRISDGQTTYNNLFIIDILENRIVKQVPVKSVVDTLYNGASISPLGNYIVVDFKNKNSGQMSGFKVYDRDLNFLWEFPKFAIHYDLGVAPDGEEILVLESPDSLFITTTIKKFRLRDGKVTDLIQISALFNVHVSCRNLERNDWAIVKAVDGWNMINYDSSNWLPFQNEVFAVKLDGSGDVRRLAHHYSRAYDSSNGRYMTKYNYRSEVHATINRKGNRLLYASNWSNNILSDSALDVYVCDFRDNLASVVENPKDNQFYVFPNPASDYIDISVGAENFQPLRNIRIYNSLGECVMNIGVENFQPLRIDITKLPVGVYSIKFQSNSGIINQTFMVLR